MSIEIKTTTDIKVAARFIADKILPQLYAGKNVLWFVPGGSAIAVAVEAAKIIAETKHHPRQNLTITLTDERYGPVDHADSNWQQIMEKGFYVPESKYMPVLNGDSPSVTIKKFNTILGKELKRADYKIGLFGIGKDGHTAGILPESGAVNSKNWAFGYKTPTFYRITVTPKTIGKLDEAVIFAEGKDKWSVLEDFEKDLGITEQPAQILKKIPRLTIFSDYQKNG
jgi:6-phosphogluconolactonase/glucosamine-6-phosphate isomerase/deaminase